MSKAIGLALIALVLAATAAHAGSYPNLPVIMRDCAECPLGRATIDLDPLWSTHRVKGSIVLAGEQSRVSFTSVYGGTVESQGRGELVSGPVSCCPGQTRIESFRYVGRQSGHGRELYTIAISQKATACITSSTTGPCDNVVIVLVYTNIPRGNLDEVLASLGITSWGAAKSWGSIKVGSL